MRNWEMRENIHCKKNRVPTNLIKSAKMQRNWTNFAEFCMSFVINMSWGCRKIVIQKNRTFFSCRLSWDITRDCIHYHYNVTRHLWSIAFRCERGSESGMYRTKEMNNKNSKNKNEDSRLAKNKFDFTGSERGRILMFPKYKLMREELEGPA